MKYALILTIAMGIQAMSTSAQTAPTCRFPASLLAPYDMHSGPREFGVMRLQIETLIAACPRGPIDAESRRILFQLVDREFTTDFSTILHAARNDEESESMWEAITIFQGDLSRYLDRIVSPADIGHKSTILRFGSGRAIAALGPAVKEEVLRLATTAGPHLSGFNHHHNSQQAAFEALGLWLASTSQFGSADRSRFTRLLIGAVDASNGIVRGGMPHVTMVTIVRSLGNADDPAAAAALRRFIERLPSQSGELFDEAARSATAVEKRTRGR